MQLRPHICRYEWVFHLLKTFYNCRDLVLSRIGVGVIIHAVNAFLSKSNR